MTETHIINSRKARELIDEYEAGILILQREEPPDHVIGSIETVETEIVTRQFQFGHFDSEA